MPQPAKPETKPFRPFTFWCFRSFAFSRWLLKGNHGVVMMRSLNTIIALILLWVCIAIATGVFISPGITLYVAFALAIGWSALSYRQRGWPWGLGLAVLLLTIPIWVLGAYGLYERWRK